MDDLIADIRSTLARIRDRAKRDERPYESLGYIENAATSALARLDAENPQEKRGDE